MPVKISLKYGSKEIKAQLPECRFIGELVPGTSNELIDLEQEIRDKLAHPVGSEPLVSLAKGVNKIAIVTPDHTRVFPSAEILPILCAHLFEAGIDSGSVTIVIGVGNHRPVNVDEKKRILGPLYNKVTCLHSKETGYIFKGITKRGTPIEVASPVAEAGLVIGLGSIELHQLAGFSGGVKAVAAGTAGRNALEHNHRLKTLQSDMTGKLEENFVRQDMEEFARVVNLRFIINVVLNEKGDVTFVTAGDPLEAHRHGCKVAKEVFTVSIEERADIVIVSPGGEPRDSTVYQAQKSVKNALKAVKDGGIIILAAQCPEGFGDEVFEKWLGEASDPEQILERAKKEFVLGGHKSVFIASAVKRAKIYLVSDMNYEAVIKMFFEPFSSLQEAIDKAFEIKGHSPSILVMPWGGLTVPELLRD